MLLNYITIYITPDPRPYIISLIMEMITLIRLNVCKYHACFQFSEVDFVVSVFFVLFEK